MPRPTSNLRIFVDFKEETVFAGEDIECTITLKNIDPSSTPSNNAPTTPTDANGSARAVDPLDYLRAARAPQLHTSPSRTASSESNPSQRPTAHSRTTSSSLSVVESASADAPTESSTGGGRAGGAGVHIASTAPEAKHPRRVSIVSLSNTTNTSQRPAVRHARSVSSQTTNASGTASSVPPLSLDSPGALDHKIRQSSQSPSPLSPSPLSESSTPPPMRPSHSRSSTVQIGEPTPRAEQQKNTSDGESGNRDSVTPSEGQITTLKSLGSQPVPPKTPPKPQDPKSSGNANQPTAAAKVFSVKSLEDTPRSSMEIYSTSNHSNETLTSEYPAQITSRLLQLPSLNRTSSQFTRPQRTRTTETLMMGYAQLSGSFSLDGSLVNQSPFEEIKRKAIVGGQGGGGVVGLSRAQGDGGLFGNLKWGGLGESIGESFSGFMGGSAMSSIKEMKSIADSSSIPLLSTAKSILFVDLKLPPGHIKSYSYKFQLPRGLPPSHRGRAMKVVYNLVIGVQRPNNARGQQQIKQVEVPFRVLSGVTSQGEFLGHDLMSPYIILKDQAQTSALDPSTPTSPTGLKELELSEDVGSSASDFEAYVNQLLTRSRRQSVNSLLSPTADPVDSPLTPHGRPISLSRPQQNLSARELIDQAIRHCSNPSSPQHVPTNFTIARASVPIASLTLSRSALRIGDLITCVVDFSGAKLPCYAFEGTLESSERIDPALAIRSPPSVERATRKVWARSIENALWATRCVFRAQVPVTATPAFTTTGVSLDWYIRLELVVGLSDSSQQGRQLRQEEEEEAAAEAAAAEEEEGVEQTSRAWTTPPKADKLLEVVKADDRATVLSAMHELPCESFEITLPIRVFGAIANGEERSSTSDSEGLTV